MDDDFLFAEIWTSSLPPHSKVLRQNLDLAQIPRQELWEGQEVSVQRLLQDQPEKEFSEVEVPLSSQFATIYLQSQTLLVQDQARLRRDERASWWNVLCQVLVLEP